MIGGLRDVWKRKQSVSALLRQLHHRVPSKREHAIHELEKRKFSIKEGLLVLHFLGQHVQKSPQEALEVGTVVRLIECCGKKMYVEYMDRLVKLYPYLEISAKKAVFHVLASDERVEALHAYLNILAMDFRELYGLIPGSLYDVPRHSRELFPRILEYIENRELASDIYLLLVCHFAQQRIDESYLGEYKSMIIQHIVDMADTMQQEDSETSATWDDPWIERLRYQAGVHFDLAGYIVDPAVQEALQRVLPLQDRKLKMFAVISLLRQGMTVDAELSMEIASDVESRVHFLRGLEELGRMDIVPEVYRRQEAIAASELVGWLSQLDELGRPPDDVELMEVVHQQQVAFYVFRFRSDHPDWQERGWMAGIAGAYRIQDEPTTVPCSPYTGSHFEPWDSKSATQHVQTIAPEMRSIRSG